MLGITVITGMLWVNLVFFGQRMELHGHFSRVVYLEQGTLLGLNLEELIPIPSQRTLIIQA